MDLSSGNSLTLADDPFAQFQAEIALAKNDVGAFSLRNGATPKGEIAQALADIKHAANKELTLLEKSLSERPKLTDADLRDGFRSAWRIVGRYLDLVLRLDRAPFDVVPETDATDHVVDIIVRWRGVPITDEAIALKAEIDTVQTIVKSVMADRAARIDSKWFWRRIDRTKAEKACKLALADYMKQLLGIAQTGLVTTEPSGVTFSSGDLKRLKALFTMREAGEVKNSYVRQLLFYAAFAATFFAVLYILARGLGDAVPPPQDGSWRQVIYAARNFHLLAAGTAVGTWLSFSLRRQELAFEDLAVLEPDRLNPMMRVLYMIGLSSLVGLLLFSGAVIAGVGSVTGLEALHQHGSWTLMIGMLAGIAERALGSAVARRSEDFAAAVGGDAPAKVKV